MSKSVLISIRPEWCEKIASGEKTVEVRKTRPKIETPFKCYIYCTQYKPKVYFYPVKGKGFYANGELKKGFFTGCVIGEFLCDRIERYARYGWARTATRYMMEVPGGYPAAEINYYSLQLNEADIERYGKGRPLYGWHISNLVIYDTPKQLSAFRNGKSVFTFGVGGQLTYSGLKRPPQSWCYVDDYAE